MTKKIDDSGVTGRAVQHSEHYNMKALKARQAEPWYDEYVRQNQALLKASAANGTLLEWDRKILAEKKLREGQPKPNSIRRVDRTPSGR